MVLRHVSEKLGAGGAANVARNLRALGAQVSVFGVVGRDPNGRELARILGANEVDMSGLVHAADRVTPTKTRVLAAESRRFPQQVLRIDREPTAPIDPAVRAELAALLRERADDFDALVLTNNPQRVWWNTGRVPVLLGFTRPTPGNSHFPLSPAETIGQACAGEAYLAWFPGLRNAERRSPATLRPDLAELVGLSEIESVRGGALYLLVPDDPERCR